MRQPQRVVVSSPGRVNPVTSAVNHHTNISNSHLLGNDASMR